MRLLGNLKEIFGVSARQARFAELERRLAAHDDQHAAHDDAHLSHRDALRTTAALNGLDEARLLKLADAIEETFAVLNVQRGHPLSKDFRYIWRRAQ